MDIESDDDSEVVRVRNDDPLSMVVNAVDWLGKLDPDEDAIDALSFDRV